MKRSLLQRRLLPFLVLLLSLPAAHAQSGQYGNEWIDYSKTYIKFKVGKTGVCRIYRPALNNAGVPASVNGSGFALYRDGQEVPVWVSAEVMGGSDYIEFWGRKADGVLDKELYLSPTDQPDDRISLFSDTACYFLTWGSGSHLRFVQGANAIPGGTLSQEPYCMATAGFYPRAEYMPGPNYEYSADLISPQFDNGEGFVAAMKDVTNPADDASASLQAPNRVGGVNATLHTNVIVRSLINYHRIKLSLNGNQFFDSSYDAISFTKRYDMTVPPSMLSASNQVTFSTVYRPAGNPTYDQYDKFGISFAELEYPRDFNLSGTDQIALQLPATGGAQYVEFTGMGAGRLYDLTNQKWYNGNTTVSGKTRFYLDPSVTMRKMVVMSDAATSITSLTPAKTFSFTNYSAAAAQGDFVMISHAALLQPATGARSVQDYAAYRASIAGGSHKVAIADVTELYDEFAYGYDIHPLSIKHFLKYAYDTWSSKPKDVLLVGKGIYYHEYSTYLNNPSLYNYPVVPVYGVPGSDLDYVMYGSIHTPRMRIGRLSVLNAGEVGTYLTKVQNAEAAMAPAPIPTVATEMWKKRAMHVVGSSSQYLMDQLLPPMNYGAAILADTFTGKTVSNIIKSSSAAVTAVNSVVVDSLLRGGLSLITFYGHGSPTSFDYKLPDPGSYNNNWHMGHFLGLGCDLSQMFQLSGYRNISEQYIVAPTAGATTFLASSNTSYTDLDNIYLHGYYNSIAYTNYGAPMGAHVNATYDSITHRFLQGVLFPSAYSTQLECMVFAGDPSITMPSPTLPDYHVADNGLVAIPSNVSTSLDSFKLRISAFNLAKAIRDTVVLKVEHINPAGVTSLVATYSVRDLHLTDTSTISIPVDKNVDLGLNKYRVTIDAPARYAEVSEQNNVGTLELFISSDNLVPVYPHEFAIVNQQGITLKASTLNPFRPLSRYRMELDTTELFNSPMKQSTTLNSIGGVMRWKPGITFTDSTVYYWRTAFDSAAAGAEPKWTASSFIYLVNGSDGWNQSHYYQYTKDFSAGTQLRAQDRSFHFGDYTNKLLIKNIVLCNTITPSGMSCNDDAQHMQNFYNDTRIDQSSYGGVVNALSVTVIDTNGRIWQNSATERYGSDPVNNPRGGTFSRQFNLASDSGRYYAANFLTNVIPNGWYVAIKNAYWHPYSSPNLFIDKWKADTAVLGPGKSLYHALYNMGFTKIDSFYKERVFVFMRRKGDASYPIYQQVTDSLTQSLEPSFDIKGTDIAGQYNSTVIGPAKAWGGLKWKTFAADSLAKNDTSSIIVMGVDRRGREEVLYTGVKGDMSFRDVSAQRFPKLRLLWKAKDSVNQTSPQLAYWRVLYTPVPEAALNPAAQLVFSDTLSQGQMQAFSVAVENLTPQPMDSMLVRYKIVGADGVTHTLADRRYRPLTGDGDTIHAAITFDPAPYPGKNLLFVEANPATDQPEQYHPNNLGYLPFRVGVDTRNPLLDVTFDGVHILNNDIVSARPFIKVRLKDDNRYLALDDTNLVKVSLRYPSDTTTTHQIPFDGTRCRFIPATKTEPVNEAYIEFRPELTEDGTYQLNVTGMDKSGNGAGSTTGSAGLTDYKIAFEVENKPSITNVLNYPNPFSTSTAFVFTLTGSQIPSQFKIQILSVTGKVVREITKGELGSLHIGRNITEYKWDGRDQFGQLLGNGVYLYRVVTSLNGEDMALREDKHSGGIDRFFKNGYGKMYIMR